MTQEYDILIIGAGIVGLATAIAIQGQRPELKLAILEKEAGVAQHQTGHNSGVVHAGIYYKSGSLKAQLCTAGVDKMRAFCHDNDLEYQRCGKVIVATSEKELPALETLFERAEANGVPGVRRVGAEELGRLEPNAAGVAAIHSPNTAIVDYSRVAQAMAQHLKRKGLTILNGQRLLSIDSQGRGLHLTTSTGDLQSNYLINCAGLYSDKIAAMMGLNPEVKIVPFRGEYYMLKPEKSTMVNGLIYPVPNPQFPFLGVHLTKMVSGVVEAGPNAVLALAREGYSHSHINPNELIETLSYSGFWRVAQKYWYIGAYEYYRSFVKTAFLDSLRRLLPKLQYKDIQRAGAGVRAQAIAKDGRLIDDFVIQHTANSLHVLNAPSPAATASLAIGEYLAKRLTV